jgi:hypothetical protein
MLGFNGFMIHLNNVEHYVNLYHAHKKEHEEVREVSLKAVERSKQVLIKNFQEQQKEIEHLKFVMRKYDKYANVSYAKKHGIEL